MRASSALSALGAACSEGQAAGPWCPGTSRPTEASIEPSSPPSSGFSAPQPKVKCLTLTGSPASPFSPGRPGFPRSPWNTEQVKAGGQFLFISDHLAERTLTCSREKG